jgi:hypothetical protein
VLRFPACKGETLFNMIPSEIWQYLGFMGWCLGGLLFGLIAKWADKDVGMVVTIYIVFSIILVILYLSKKDRSSR